MENQRLYSWVSKAKTGKTLFCKPIPLFGDGSVRRDFTHVTDICAGLFSALTAEDAVGETINLGHHDPIEMRRLIALLEELAGKPARIDYRPARTEDLLPRQCLDS